MTPLEEHKMNSSVKYRWLLFDADGTLFDYDRAEATALRRAFARFDQPFEPEYAAAYRRINADLWRAYERGEIDQDRLRLERFARLFAALGLDLNAAQFSAIYLQHLAQAAYLIPGAEDVLTALHGKMGLALITNGVADVQRSRLGRSTIGGYLSPWIISGEVGVAKPDRAIFEIAFRAMGQPRKKEVLIIGDSLTSDMEGGRSFGIDTCWFNPRGKPRPPGIEVHYEIRDLREILHLV